MQLSLFAAAPTTVPLDPLGEATYRFRRGQEWWDGRQWVDAECMAIRVIGERCRVDELAIIGASVDVIDEKGEVINGDSV